MVVINKKAGTRFEVEFCRILKNNGFWARMDHGFAQTVDVIGAKNNVPYLFECKVCQKDYFNLNRVELNQSLSRRRFLLTGNTEAYFVYKITATDEIYLSKNPIKKPSHGIAIDEFFQAM